MMNRMIQKKESAADDNYNEVKVIAAQIPVST
jgi:hypothetical protein